MKHFTIPSLLGLLVSLSSGPLRAQEREAKEQISQEFTLSTDAGRHTLALHNIEGSVTVQAYAGRKVVLEATKTIRAHDAPTLELGKREVQLAFLQRNDSVVAYLKEPFDSRPNRNNCNGNHQQINYDYAVDYVVKVPYQINLHVSTINNGTVLIEGVTGTLKAYNVNGAVTLRNVQGLTTARTVNGDVEATYVAQPPGASSYNTINGEIKVTYPADLSADIHFKSMHGELFTNFPNVETLPLQVTQGKRRSGGGTQYKLTKDTAVRLGRGGKDFRFETLNGNVTIKQQPQ